MAVELRQIEVTDVMRLASRSVNEMAITMWHIRFGEYFFHITIMHRQPHVVEHHNKGVVV
jgi:hypothetical protein